MNNYNCLGPRLCYKPWVPLSSSYLSSKGKQINQSGGGVKINDDEQLINEIKDSIACFLNINANLYLDKYNNGNCSGKGMWFADDYEKYMSKMGKNYDNDILSDPETYEGYADPQFFTRNDTFGFLMNKNVIPSEALIKFLEGPSMVDCGTATVAIYYKTILDVLECLDKTPDAGKQKFNDLFQNIFEINQSSYPLSMLLITREEGKKKDQYHKGTIGNRPVKIGDHLHFGGIKWYTNKHPAGFAGGWNVFYVGNNDKGEQVFMGLGLSKPITERELNDSFVCYYNQPQTEKDLQYIEEFNEPATYDRKRNEWLRDYYILDPDKVRANPQFFLEGFLPFSRASIDPHKIAEILKINE